MRLTCIYWSSLNAAYLYLVDYGGESLVFLHTAIEGVHGVVKLIDVLRVELKERSPSHHYITQLPQRLPKTLQNPIIIQTSHHYITQLPQ